jgi:hypothetical protein
MLHSLRDIKKTNLKKYGGVGETLLRQNFSLISDVNLYQEILDNIGLEFRSDGTYSAKLAYKMKFEVINSTSLNASSLKEKIKKRKFEGLGILPNANSLLGW